MMLVKVIKIEVISFDLLKDGGWFCNTKTTYRSINPFSKAKTFVDDEFYSGQTSAYKVFQCCFNLTGDHCRGDSGEYIGQFEMNLLIIAVRKFQHENKLLINISAH